MPSLLSPSVSLFFTRSLIMSVSVCLAVSLSMAHLNPLLSFQFVYMSPLFLPPSFGVSVSLSVSLTLSLCLSVICNLLLLPSPHLPLSLSVVCLSVSLSIYQSVSQLLLLYATLNVTRHIFLAGALP